MLLNAQLDGLGKVATHRPGQAISSFEGEVVGRRHSEVLARAVRQVDGHDKVVRRAAHGNVLAGRPFGNASRQLAGRRQQVHFRLAIALGVLGHSRSFP